jgi:sterol desaturase/sphingolipid hydroxylase (fatty acid hydroxylase superfamily)
MDVDPILLEYEPAIRLGFFFAVFAVMAAWEVRDPRRALNVPKPSRWVANLGILLLNGLLLRLIFPAAALGMTVFAQLNGWGVLNYLALPLWLETMAAVLILDLAIYLQHVMFHSIPALWRLHRVHHADLDFDVTTGSRFHPIEILLSMAIKFAVIAALGPAVLAVLVFEVLLNAMAMFNHSNVRIPTPVDRWLRRLVVTPDMHRVHHSVEVDEANSNFGFSLSWWDRLLGTYHAQPRSGHREMIIGLEQPRDPAVCDRLPGMLALPFRGSATGYPINRRWDAR